MHTPIAGILTRDSIPSWYRLVLILAIGVISLAARYWRFFLQWLEGMRGRDWATISAVVDVVSVVQQTANTRSGTRVVGYLATLTYFYRNPELQMGEYSRIFGEESEAQSWAASYKGRNVMVHLDPRDPTHSVLRQDEL